MIKDDTFKCRELYAPAHFGNSYEAMYRTEAEDLLTEAKHWGFNTYSDWYDAADLRDPGNNPRRNYLLPQALLDRKIEVFTIAVEHGFDTDLLITPNHVYIDQLRPDILAEAGDDRIFGQLICPSKPAAREIILENHRYLFKRLAGAGVPLSFVSACPYDYGGCSCTSCNPWITAFGQLMKDIYEIAIESFPDVRPRLIGWWWTAEEHAVFREWADREAPGLFTGMFRHIKYGESVPDMSAPLPDGCAEGAFVHTGYPDINKPPDVYGAWGPTAAHDRIPRTVAGLTDAGVDSFMAYSEGFFDDVNRAILAGIGSGQYTSSRDVLIAYAERYFGFSGSDASGWAEWLTFWGRPFEAHIAEARTLFNSLPRPEIPTWRYDQWEAKLELFEAHNSVTSSDTWDDTRIENATRFYSIREKLYRDIWRLGPVRHGINAESYPPPWAGEYEETVRAMGTENRGMSIDEA